MKRLEKFPPENAETFVISNSSPVQEDAFRAGEDLAPFLHRDPRGVEIPIRMKRLSSSGMSSRGQLEEDPAAGGEEGDPKAAVASRWSSTRSSSPR
jgi:hypothetical protein